MVGNFTQVPNEIVKNPDLTLGEKAMWTILKSFDFGHGDIFPSLATLSSESGLSEKQVRRIIKSLEQKGYVEIIQRFNKSNIYVLHSTPSNINSELASSQIRESPLPNMSIPSSQECPSNNTNRIRYNNNICTSPSPSASPTSASIDLSLEQQALLERISSLPWPNYQPTVWEKYINEHGIEVVEYAIATTKNDLELYYIDNPFGYAVNVIKNKIYYTGGLSENMDYLQVAFPDLDVKRLWCWVRDNCRIHGRQPTHRQFTEGLISGRIQELVEQKVEDVDARIDSWKLCGPVIPESIVDEVLNTTNSA
ncbi:helix-turn-helix domain-containing protein [Desulfomonile tiedjei]|uniref:Transcriptional regulator n=1 Tax=Desulfomonile tiedjei (strain ATCC 49306 / DSM 6799 / DCB-1) TaxID=706587 RepID=I4CDT9_DESTA|nr:helix-turn-helix domain-containing protein [Desulfomonile tiedjei]AFM27730.1 transcriptional regulator [Desulfomonile tiedjei DSM 6799]